MNKEQLIPHDEAAKKILDARASQLARTSIKESDKSDEAQCVCFCFGKNELYGVPYTFVVEVLADVTITPVPFVPDYIAGTINHYGKLIAIINLKNFFNIPTNHPNKINNIILIEDQNKKLKVGILVDSIKGTSSFNSNLLAQALNFTGFIKPAYLLGLYNGAIAIINVPAILEKLKMDEK